MQAIIQEPTISSGFFLGLLFGPEDEGDMFLRNIGLFTKYTALKYTIPHYS
jgi:hypothetical protein